MKKVKIKFNVVNMANAYEVVDNLPLDKHTVKDYEIELQRIIVENLKEAGINESWWKSTNAQIFNDLLDLKKKNATEQEFVMYIVKLFDEVYEYIMNK